MSDQDPKLHRVELTLCELCLDGKGGECHVPGCALCWSRAPDLPLRDHPMVSRIDGWPLCRRCCMKRASKRLARHCDREPICEQCADEVVAS